MSVTNGNGADSIRARQQEEAMYEQVAAEMAARDIKKGLWAKALSLSDGSVERAKPLYIKLRVQALMDEAALKAQQERPQPRPVEMPERPPVRRDAAAASGDWQDYGAPSRPAPAVEKPHPAASSRREPARTLHVDQSKTFLGGSTHPWRRYFARTLDSIIFTLILVGLMFGFAYTMPEQSAGILTKIGNQNGGVIYVIILLLWVPIEAIFLSQFGATPAKGLFGIKVTHTDGRLLNFWEALARSLRALIQGNGVGIPLFALFTNLFAYQRLTKTGTTLWDTATDADVKHEEWNALRVLAIIFVSFISAAMILALSAGGSSSEEQEADRQQSSQSSAPARAANTQTAATPANINAPVDKYGNTALMLASLDGDTASVRRLLAAGADINASNKTGQTALTVASSQGKADVVTVLINSGAYINSSTQYGWTALILAAQFGHAEVARRLIRAGADINVTDQQGITALQRAEFFAQNPNELKEFISPGMSVGYEHEEIVRLLKAAGARR